MPPASQHPTRIATRPPRVLVIDDDPFVRRMLARVLRKWGFVALFAASGREGLEAAALGPACVLCDLELPDMEGEALVERLAARVDGAPIVVLSGRAPEWEAPPVGVAAVLPKPFDLLALVEQLKGALGRGASRSSRPSSPA
jgi:CheY-like chemotaxis protein